jgi:transcriptional regulator with XRE-family HTH domain
MLVSTDPPYQHISSNLRRLRRQRKLSQQTLAVLAGVSRPTIAHLECGTRIGGTSYRVIDKLCRALGVPLACLLDPAVVATTEPPR